MINFKKDLEAFEYDSRKLTSDHKWDRLISTEETKKFYDAKQRMSMLRYKRNRVQSNPETTGQYGTMI